MIRITDLDDIERCKGLAIGAARQASDTLRVLCEVDRPPLELLAALKFLQCGRHPMEDRSLNLVEQVNQTFSMLVALEGCRELLARHPGISLLIDPGAAASTTSDIVSEDGSVAAECFAAVDARNNRKLVRDIQRLSKLNPGTRCYIFYADTTTRVEVAPPNITICRIPMPLLGIG